jgi:hypothetical protein
MKGLPEFSLRTAGRSALLAAILLLSPVAMPAQEYTVDRSASEAVTRYLREHRLPLVGAQVSTSKGSGRQVMLFGYVATSEGKRNAEAKVRDYLHDPSVGIIDRVVVEPRLKEMEAARNAASGAGASSFGAETGWDQVIQEINRYGYHPAADQGNNFLSP